MIRKPFLCLSLIALSGPVLAQDFDGIDSAQFRSGWLTTSSTHMTALDMQLHPGWKTYWRAPGDAGIPPQFDWTGSDNIGSVTIHWPSPEVFVTNGLRSVGYHDALVLPLEVTPLDASRPVSVELTVHLGICKDICLPATVTVSGEAVGAGAPDSAIRSALAVRPMTTQEARVGAVHCSVEPIKDGLRVTAKMEVPRLNQSSEAVIFETGDPAIWVSEAKTSRQGDTVVAVAEMVGPTGLPFALMRDKVILSLMSGMASVEILGCPAP